jgi:uncharacterized phage protein (TIGR01671 family)
MREIKFRAWDVIDQKMYEVQSLDMFWGIAELYFWREDGTKSEIIKRSYPAIVDNETDPIIKLHIMQYTGQKDKGGKEIWEGDVVVSNGLCPVSGKEYQWVSRVEWIKDGWGLVHHGKHDGCVQQHRVTDAVYVEGCYWGTIEVIGTIHDNPESERITNE